MPPDKEDTASSGDVVNSNMPPAFKRDLGGAVRQNGVIPLHAGIDAHLVAAVAWRVPPTKTVA